MNEPTTTTTRTATILAAADADASLMSLDLFGNFGKMGGGKVISIILGEIKNGNKIHCMSIFRLSN